MYLAVAVTLGALTQAPVPSPAGVVRIDVIAADARGRVVANLTAADFERNYMANTPGRADSQRAQVTWSALNALAVRLGTVGPGRKTMVLVSEGLPVAERRRGFELMPTFASVVRAANRSAASIYIV